MVSGFILLDPKYHKINNEINSFLRKALAIITNNPICHTDFIVCVGKDAVVTFCYNFGGEVQ